MEKNNWLIGPIEKLSTSWASPAVAEYVNKLGDDIVQFINPDTVGAKTVTSDYLMAGFLATSSLTVFYLCSVFLLRMIVKSTPESKPSVKGENQSTLERFKNEPLMLVACVYNLTQVVLCTYMAGRALMVALDLKYSLVCNKFELSDDKMAKVHWVFFMSKILDFIDTYLIILRRKWRQLSFLHLYHHSSIFVVSWLYNQTAYDGDVYFAIVGNSAVHMVMYSYYLLRTFNVHIPQVLKKMVTNMQIIQFVLMLLQALYIVSFGCPFPTKAVLFYFAYITSMLVLFLNFFIVNYLKKSDKSKKQKSN